MPARKPDWQAMKAMAVQVHGTAENVQAELTTLRGALEEFAPQWQTDGATALASTRVLWDDDAARLCDALEEVAVALDAIAERYRLAAEAS